MNPAMENQKASDARIGLVLSLELCPPVPEQREVELKEAEAPFHQPRGPRTATLARLGGSCRP